MFQVETLILEYNDYLKRNVNMSVIIYHEMYDTQDLLKEMWVARKETFFLTELQFQQPKFYKPVIEHSTSEQSVKCPCKQPDQIFFAGVNFPGDC